MITVMTVVAIIVGSILAGFYQMVSPRIEANRLAEEKRAIFSVLPEAKDYVTIDLEVGEGDDKESLMIFRGVDDDNAPVGYAFVSEGPGFAAAIVMMVGLNINTEELTGMKVLEQIETPGLGNKIAMEPFESQFRGLKIKPAITYIKNKKPESDNQIQAITGATISSVAIVKALNKTIKVLMPFILEDIRNPVVIERQVEEEAVPEPKEEEK